MSGKNLTKEQIAQYKKVFRIFDKDGNGQVSFGEFKEALKFFKIKMTDEEIKAEIAKYDQTGNNMIGFCEFIGILTGIQCCSLDDKSEDN